MCLQIWVDPKYPNAWKVDPIKWFIIQENIREHVGTIIRTPKGGDFLVMVGYDESGEPILETFNPPIRQPEGRDESIAESCKVFQEVHPTEKHR